MYGLNVSWPWSPGALVIMLAFCVLYGLAIRQVRQGNVQEEPQEKRLTSWRSVAFVIAVVGMAFVFLTPLDSIARTQLFLTHMAQAVILTTLCAPLLLLAFPAWFLSPFLLRPAVRRVVQVFTHPIIASLIFNINFLAWHAPGLFHFAQTHATLYHVELMSFFFTALLNWWPLIGPVHEFRKLSYPLQMLYAFLDGQPVDIFAFLLVFSGTVIYPYYAAPSQLGITPFGDQASGGALLLIPGLVDLLVMSPLFIRWLAQMEERQKLNDQRMQELAEAQEVARLREEAERM